MATSEDYEYAYSSDEDGYLIEGGDGAMMMATAKQ
jgi:hypothetical protein